MESFITDKVCMVTGGGGSIGGEIVRALSRMGAARIVAVDISENGLYDVITDISGITAEIASTRDESKMEYLMSKYRPNIVFHAAAHKHVPFMETNPEEAVKNNIHGTQITADLAEKYGVPLFDFNLLRSRYELFSDETSFSDDSHLSREGAEVFAAVMADILSRYRAGEDVSPLFNSSYQEVIHDSVYWGR